VNQALAAIDAAAAPLDEYAIRQAIIEAAPDASTLKAEQRRGVGIELFAFEAVGQNPQRPRSSGLHPERGRGSPGLQRPKGVKDGDAAAMDRAKSASRIKPERRQLDLPGLGPSLKSGVRQAADPHQKSP
jgi:hypothetical protein